MIAYRDQLEFRWNLNSHKTTKPQNHLTKTIKQYIYNYRK